MDGRWSLDIASYGVAAVEDEFAALFDAAGAPPDAALFSERLERDRVRLYFSPEAVRIATRVLRNRCAVACAKPTQADEVLVSSGDAAMLLRVELRDRSK